MPLWRPAARPGNRWARSTLYLLLFGALLRAILWAVAVPPFWAPDEDYHFSYIEYVSTTHSIPKPGQPLYPREYGAVTKAIHYDDYGAGPRSADYYKGPPDRTVTQLRALPKSYRTDREKGRGVGVIHPPLYYVLGAAINASLGDASILTRIFVLRLFSGLIGVFAIWAAWLLASQLLGDSFSALITTCVVASLPMMGFFSAVISNDMPIILMITLVLGYCCFMTGQPGALSTSATLGVLLGLAVLTKSTAYALVPIGVVTIASQIAAWRPDRGRVGELAKHWLTMLATFALVAGAWIIYARLALGTTSGAVHSVSGNASMRPVALGDYVLWASEWLKLDYRTLFYHYLWWEAPRGWIGFLAPAVVMVVGVGTTLIKLAPRFRSLFAPKGALIRQVLFVLFVAGALLLPPLYVDVLRRAHGSGFILVAGRFQLPAAAGVAAVVVLGFRLLFQRRVFPWAMAFLLLCSTLFSAYVFGHNYLSRYVGDVGLGETARRLTFDHPGWVSVPLLWTVTLTLVITGIGVAFCLTKLWLDTSRVGLCTTGDTTRSSIATSP